MANKPILWERNAEKNHLRPPNSGLRLPNINKETNSSQETKNKPEEKKDTDTALEKRLDDLIANSTLKVDAPEWYPSNCKPTPVRPVTTSVQGRLKKFNKSNDCIASQAMAEIAYPNSFSPQNYNSDDDSPDIIRIKQIITTLIKDPGQFDNLLGVFMDTLIPYFEDIIALSVIAKLLVEQAINSSNFRYTGARLCWYIEQSCPEFRAELHLKCKKQMEGDGAGKCDALLFVAELYAQLPHLNVYGALLVDAMKQLLQEAGRGNENVKCVCQALKLTGYSLEQSNRQVLDEVFLQLRMARDTVDGSALILLNSVLNLRTSNWGHSMEKHDGDSESEEFYLDGGTQNTVFYHTTDGHTFTNEESEFLAAHMNSNEEYLSDTSDPDDLCDPEPEMDEEIQAAFREFVRLSKH